MNNNLAAEARNHRICSGLHHLYHVGIFALPLSFALIYLSLFVNYIDAFYGTVGFTNANPMLNDDMAVLFVAGLTIVFVISVIKLVEYKSDFLYKYRWLIGMTVAMLAVAFKISGSSLGMWNIMLPENAGTPFWGIPRSLRSDEFSVGTLFQLSQTHNGYAPISEILRGDLTDVRMVYGAACWSVITLFRPVIWGYLLFGFEFGLAFAWSARLCLMVLVSFDCSFLIIKSKPLSLLFSCLLCFSPLIQWWGTGEVILYGQALVLLLDRALFARKRNIRIIAIAAIAWLCGCYIMLMYPAWMVPFFFIFALMGVFRTIEYCQSLKYNDQQSVLAWSLGDTFVLVFCLLISAGLVFLSFFQSSEAMTSVMNTVYPGARFETGGSGLPELFSYAISLFYAFGSPLVSNECEIATFFVSSLLERLHLCSVLLKGRDWQLFALTALQLFFLVFAFIGFPSFLSRMTLMYNVPVLRLLFPIGYLELLLFLISIEKVKEFQGNNSSIGYLPIILMICLILSSAFQISILPFCEISCCKDAVSVDAYIVLSIFVPFVLLLYSWKKMYRFIRCFCDLLRRNSRALY